MACPQFPTLPAVPQMVQPDRWLRRVHQWTFARTVQADGGVSIDRREYYVGRALAGQRVACVVQAASQHFDIWHGDSYITHLPIKGLHGGPALPFEEYVTGISQQARSEYRQYLATHRRLPSKTPVGLSAGQEALQEDRLAFSRGGLVIGHRAGLFLLQRQ